MTEIFDITIIGAGPVGLFTGFYAGLRQAKVKIIDSLEQVGGQPHHLYPEKYIYDIPGFPKINGHELARELTKQLELFPHQLCLGEEVEMIQFDNETETYQVMTQKETHLTKTIIIAAGNGAFNPKKLTLAGIETFEKSNLHYYVKSMDYYKNKRIAILGGGDSAVDWALSLSEVASQVYLIHRRDKFRALESSVAALNRSYVKVLTPYVMDNYQANGSHIETIQLSKVKSDETLSLEIDDVIVNYGFSSSMGPIRQWGLNIERNGIIVNSFLETNLAGVYAVGDIANYPGKMKLIATGFGEAPMAVNQAIQYIHPEQKQVPVHSSDLF